MSTDHSSDPVESPAPEGTAPDSGPDFADGKDLGAFRTIGEVAQAFGIKQHVLRYWEEQFPMLRPLKRAGGRRYYRPEDIRLIGEINRLLHAEGFTIRGARQALAGKGAVPTPTKAPRQTVPAMPAPANAGTAGLAASLRAVRDSLSQALSQS